MSAFNLILILGIVGIGALLVVISKQLGDVEQLLREIVALLKGGKH